jgi:hypothetical protein
MWSLISGCHSCRCFAEGLVNTVACASTKYTLESPPNRNYLHSFHLPMRAEYRGAYKIGEHHMKVIDFLYKALPIPLISSSATRQ